MRSAAQAQLRALEALRLMRRDGVSRQRAAHRANTTPRTIARYVGSALKKDRGRYVALAGDRLARPPLRVLTTEGPKDLIVRGSRGSSLVGAHWNAIERFLSTGDTNRLTPFRGKRVAGHTLETDPDAIEREARRGELEFEDLYQP